MLPDTGPAGRSPAAVRRLLFCSGKVYFELERRRQQLQLEHSVAIVRLEQVSGRFYSETSTVARGF